LWDGSAQSAASLDATFTTAAVSTNLIGDPGFESAGAGWAIAPQAAIDGTAANAHSGTRSLKLVANGAWQATTQALTIGPGQTLQVSGWERSTTSGGYFTLISTDAAGTWLTFINLIFPGTGSWTSLSQTYVTPPGTTQVLIGLQSSVPGTFWFDDLTVTTVP